MDTTNKEREMRVRVDRIVGFAKQFDEAHLNLACHAAFPLVLTPDLLYQSLNIPKQLVKDQQRHSSFSSGDEVELQRALKNLKEFFDGEIVDLTDDFM